MSEQLSRREILKTAIAGAVAAGVVGAGVAPSLLLADDSTSRPTPAHEDLLLWYDKPARQWVEALAIGNGRIGAMIFGGIDSERIELNDNTLYSGEPGRRDLPSLEITRDFEQVVDWLREGKYAEVHEYVSRHWLGRQQESYQPLGELQIKFNAAEVGTCPPTSTAGGGFGRRGGTPHP
jgi:alpha-L-fucosidase 2